jgi:uncharacterized protein (DUF1499 family)
MLLVVSCWVSVGTRPAYALNPSPVMALFSFAGDRPANLGVTEGKLRPCPQTPNCVNSQTSNLDEQHAIAPLSLTASPSDSWEALKTTIAGQERAEIIQASDRYLYVEFTSALMGFVDDVEFYLDPDAPVIHTRSASRLGESDLGVNRQRIETIRELLEPAS